MKRKKTEKDATKQVLAQVTEGVIDLDEPTMTEAEAGQGTGKTDVKLDPTTGQHVGFTPGLSAQALARPKRKYTRRSKKVEIGIAVTPTFIDKDGIRSARIQAFIDYVDGNRTFDSAASYDDHLKKLLEIADNISARLLADVAISQEKAADARIAGKIDG